MYIPLNFSEDHQFPNRTMPNVAVLVMGPAGAGKVISTSYTHLNMLRRHSAQHLWTPSLSRNDEHPT